MDTSVSGTYEITYTVTDAAGNRAQAVRTVKVIAVEYNTDFCIGANIVTGDNSGSQSTKVSNMFDGDKATRFRSWQNKDGCTGEHILDLGAAKQFNQLVVVQAADTARLFTLTLQIGESASGPWSNVIDPVDIPKADGGVTTRNFDPISAR